MAARKSSSDQPPIPVFGSGVMLVDQIVPMGLSMGRPPASGSPPSAVWQATQSPAYITYWPWPSSGCQSAARFWVGAERFTGTKEQTLWYYRALIVALEHDWSHPLVGELRTVIDEVHTKANA